LETSLGAALRHANVTLTAVYAGVRIRLVSLLSTTTTTTTLTNSAALNGGGAAAAAAAAARYIVRQSVTR